jgi:hypothetical protein
MNPSQSSEQQLVGGCLPLSTDPMPCSSTYETDFGYGIGAYDYIWPENVFPDQIFPILDFPPDGPELPSDSHAIGRSTSQPDNGAEPQTCICAATEQVLDLQVRVANLEHVLNSRLVDLEAKLEQL